MFVMTGVENGLCADGDDFTSNTIEGIELSYTVISEAEKTCKVDECDKSTISGPVTIPATVNGYSVVLIENGTFKECAAITAVNIPGSVKCIGKNAFEECAGLSTVIIPEGVEEISSSAFRSCTNMISLSLPGSLKKIGSSAFGGLKKLEKVIIPDFARWCEVEIDYYGSPFDSADDGKGGIDHLIHLYIDEETEVTDLVIPTGPTKIPKYAFYGLKTIQSVTIPEGVTMIDYDAFYGCNNLKSVSFPSSIKEIDSRAFYHCDNLDKLIITDIASWCGLELDSSPFSTLGFNVSYSIYSDANTEIKDLIVPDGVRAINGYVFKNCTNINSIRIPSSVSSIGNYAFYDCMGLQRVYSLINIPFNLDTSVFGNSTENYPEKILYSSVSLYVPEGRESLYRNAEGWNLFQTIKEFDPAGVDMIKADEAVPTDYYTVGGNRVATAKSGLNIIRMSDGTVKKVLVK